MKNIAQNKPVTTQMLQSLLQQGRPIVLLGMMGAGKTTVARQLSTILGINYYDMDKQIEKHLSCPIPEYFESHGEPAFRKVEAQIIHEYITRGCSILALGGGAFIQDSLREELLQHALCIYLDVPIAVSWQRVKSRKVRRPMIDKKDSEKKFVALFETRHPIYALAPFHVKWNDESSGETALKIKQLLWNTLQQSNRKDD